MIKSIRSIGITFAILGVVFLVMAILPLSHNRVHVLGITFQDSHPFMATERFMIIPALFCGFMSAVYLLTKRLDPFWGKLHFGGSMLFILGLCLPFVGLMQTTYDPTVPRRVYISEGPILPTKGVIDMMDIAIVLMVIGSIGQLSLLVNIVRSRVSKPVLE